MSSKFLMFNKADHKKTMIILISVNACFPYFTLIPKCRLFVQCSSILSTCEFAKI